MKLRKDKKLTSLHGDEAIPKLKIDMAGNRSKVISCLV